MSAWLLFMEVMGASIYGFGGVIFGEGMLCVPIVVCLEWPEVIKADVNPRNPKGRLTNSDLCRVRRFGVPHIAPRICAIR